MKTSTCYVRPEEYVAKYYNDVKNPLLLDSVKSFQEKFESEVRGQLEREVEDMIRKNDAKTERTFSVGRSSYRISWSGGEWENQRTIGTTRYRFEISIYTKRTGVWQHFMNFDVL